MNLKKEPVAIINAASHKKHLIMKINKQKTFFIKLIFAITLLICSTDSYGQKEILQYLEGERIKAKEGLFLSMAFQGDEALLEYFVGRVHHEDVDQVNSNTRFLIDNSTAVYLKWINPLKYSLNLKSTRKDDDIDEGVKAFKSGLSSTFYKLAEFEEKQIEFIDELFSAPSNTYQSLKDANDEVFSGDLQLYTWMQIAKLKIEEFKDKNTFKDLKDRLLKLDSLARNSFKKDLEEVNSTLFAISDPQIITNESDGYKKAEYFSVTLSKAIDKLKSETEYFKGIEYEKLLRKDTISISGELIIYTKSAVLGFTQKIGLRINELENIRARVKKLMNVLKESTNHLYEGKFIHLTPSISVSRGQEMTLSITINSVPKNNQDSKEILTKNLIFGRFKKFVPFVSSGVFYSSLQFNSFETGMDDQNQITIQEVTESRKPVYALMLNYTVHVKNSDVLPFIQLGIDPTKERPFLLFGGGLSFTNLGFAIAGGMAWSWEKSLDGFDVGDVVKGTAEIRAATKFNFNLTPKIYLGIQIGL